MLDLDVGQSEFAPSGCLSLCEIKKPLLGKKPFLRIYFEFIQTKGAPFASMETALQNSYFFGSNNIGVDLELYKKLVYLLFQRFREIVSKEIGLNQKFMLIVNTAGWIEG